MDCLRGGFACRVVTDIPGTTDASFGGSSPLRSAVFDMRPNACVLMRWCEQGRRWWATRARGPASASIVSSSSCSSRSGGSRWPRRHHRGTASAPAASRRRTTSTSPSRPSTSTPRGRLPHAGADVIPPCVLCHCRPSHVFVCLPNKPLLLLDDDDDGWFCRGCLQREWSVIEEIVDGGAAADVPIVVFVSPPGCPTCRPWRTECTCPLVLPSACFAIVYLSPPQHLRQCLLCLRGCYRSISTRWYLTAHLPPATVSFTCFSPHVTKFCPSSLEKGRVNGGWEWGLRLCMVLPAVDAPSRLHHLFLSLSLLLFFFFSSLKENINLGTGGRNEGFCPVRILFFFANGEY